MPQPTAETLRKRNTLQIGKERVNNITSTAIPGHYPSEDHAWSLPDFRRGVSVRFHRNAPLECVFSLVGLDASLANAFRRILLAEIPMLAVEDVFVQQNTSVVQDEVLAHRLGLVPLRGNKEGIRWLRWRAKGEEDGETPPARDCDTVQLELKLKCTWKSVGRERSRNGEDDPKLLYDNAHVYASQLRFTPIGQQERQYFTEEAGPIAPVHPDILLTKMRPDQELNILMHAVKGIGVDHAKFSQVATASYRLLPTIDILEPILNEDAKKFAKCFSPGVIELEKDGDGSGDVKAVVRDPMRDTVSRECLRHDELKNKVKLGRQRDHFIFSVESVGQFDSDELFVDSVKIMREKCVRLKRCLADLRETG